MDASLSQVVWFLPVAVPICIWVAWSDLKHMTIPNASVIALACWFVIIGWIALPFGDFGWRLVQMIAMLGIGIVAHYFRMVGGGDAKFAAAAAGYVAFSDIDTVLIVFAGLLLAAFVTHRSAARIPALRRATAGWKSFEAGKNFPMGLPLAGTLLYYFALVAVAG